MRRKQLMVVSWTKATLVRCSRSAKTHINTCNAKKNREKGRTKKKKIISLFFPFSFLQLDPKKNGRGVKNKKGANPHIRKRKNTGNESRHRVSDGSQLTRTFFGAMFME